MTEANDPAPTQQPDTAAQPDAVPPPPPPTGAVPAPAYAAAPATAGAPGTMPIGTIRSTGTCILLTIVTLGIYALYWYFKTHEEMKNHSGTGLGGAVALILGIFVGIAMPFLTAHEVGGLYGRRGQPEPVSAVTGVWVLLPLIGSIIWFVKTNGALNAYWRSVGAQG
jgi:hypothetical protein